MHFFQHHQRQVEGTTNRQELEGSPLFCPYISENGRKTIVVGWCTPPGTPTLISQWAAQVVEVVVDRNALGVASTPVVSCRHWHVVAGADGSRLPTAEVLARCLGKSLQGRGRAEEGFAVC
jgi:hypothetical protein